MSGKFLARMARAGSALVAIMMLAGPAGAGAWMQAPGTAQIITTVTYHSSSGGFDDAGRPVASPYRRIEIAPYLEYGATPWLTLGAQPRYQWAEAGSGAGQESAHGGGDVDLFARVKGWDVGPWVTSAQLTAIIANAYDKARRPAPGTGDDAYEARLLAGRNLGKSSLSYLDLEAGYRAGTGGVADQFRFDAALGLRPGERWILLQEASLTKSLGHGDGAPGHAYDVAKLRASAVYFITQSLGVQAGYERDVAGSGVGLGDTGIFALWVRI